MKRHLTFALSVAVLAAALTAVACGGGSPSPSPTPTSSLTASPSASPPALVVNVRSFGATGNGSSDDSAALMRALAKASKNGDTVYLPAGTYACQTPIRLPDGVRIRGDGDSSWLKGELIFASRDAVEQLKIGHVGQCAATNAPDAAGTTFTDCRLHGGGSTQGVDSSVLYLGGTQGNVSGVIFSGCRIERTSYVPPAGFDAYAGGVGNTITIHEFCYLPHGGHVERVTFRNCYLGAFNGHASGALRTVMEAFTWDNHTGLAYHGWKDLTFEGCTIAASDAGALDFADRVSSSTGQHVSSGVLIDGCTFLGAAKGAGGHGGQPITYECPTGIVITNNTFYATPHEAIGGSNVGQGVSDAPGLLVKGNTFNMTSSPVGLTHVAGEPCINLTGFKSHIVDNTFIYRSGLGVIVEADKFPAAGNVVEGNTFTDRRASGGEPTIELTDKQGRGCYENHIVGNTITNRAAGAAGVIAQSARGTNFVQGNTIYRGNAVPFVVLAGRLVRSANSLRP